MTTDPLMQRRKGCEPGQAARHSVSGGHREARPGSQTLRGCFTKKSSPQHFLVGISLFHDLKTLCFWKVQDLLTLFSGGLCISLRGELSCLRRTRCCWRRHGHRRQGLLCWALKGFSLLELPALLPHRVPGAFQGPVGRVGATGSRQVGKGHARGLRQGTA